MARAVAGMVAGDHHRDDAGSLAGGTASAASGRGGSISPTRPMKVSPVSSEAASSASGTAGKGFSANASTRRPCASQLLGLVLQRGLFDGRGSGGFKLIDAQRQHALGRALHQHQHAPRRRDAACSCARARNRRGAPPRAAAPAAARPCRTRPPARLRAARSRWGRRPACRRLRPRHRCTAPWRAPVRATAVRLLDPSREPAGMIAAAGTFRQRPARSRPASVLRQRAGLVGADVGDRAERLHRRQAADQRVLLDHARRAQRKRDGDHRGQRLGDGGDREADRGEQHQQRRLAAQPAGDENDDADRQHHQRKMPGRSAPAASAAASCRIHRTAARRSSPARSACRSPPPGRARVRRSRPSPCRRGCGGRRAAARSCSRLASCLSTGCDSPVSADSSTLRAASSVRRRSAGRMLPASSSTRSPGTRSRASIRPGWPSRITRRLRAGHLLQRRHRAFGAVFLDEADDAVEEHDDHDGDGVLRLADEAGDDCGGDQHQDHEIGELRRQHDERVAPAGLREGIGSGLRQPRCSRIGSQPLIEVAVELRSGRLAFEAMPVDGGFPGISCHIDRGTGCSADRRRAAAS